MSFPSIAEPSKISVRYIKTQNLTQLGYGKTMVSVADTISSKEFTLLWENMDQDDLDALEAAVKADMGASFSWTHDYTLDVHTVIYAENGFEYSMTEDYVPEHYNVTLKLREVGGFSSTSTTTTSSTVTWTSTTHSTTTSTSSTTSTTNSTSSTSSTSSTTQTTMSGSTTTSSTSSTTSTTSTTTGTTLDIGELGHIDTYGGGAFDI